MVSFQIWVKLPNSITSFLWDRSQFARAALKKIYVLDRDREKLKGKGRCGEKERRQRNSAVLLHRSWSFPSEGEYWGLEPGFLCTAMCVLNQMCHCPASTSGFLIFHSCFFFNYNNNKKRCYVKSATILKYLFTALILFCPTSGFLLSYTPGGSLLHLITVFVIHKFNKQIQ